MREKIVAGNWKMNCNRDESLKLATEIKGMITGEKINNAKVILFPPFVTIGIVTQVVSGSGIEVGAQNCSTEKSGAYTGEVSAEMIGSLGAQYVIIGHSERRQYYNETHDELKKKTDRALESGLTPVFCCGEILSQREAGEQNKIVLTQLKESLFHLNSEMFSKIIIAYEPVWAIGTGITASAEQAQEMHQFIRKVISDNYNQSVADQISILYGGSCNENNARELFSLPDVDGGLIGGASLKSRSFVNIVKCL
jgi:triosephosphate isomerase (TIM)